MSSIDKDFWLRRWLKGETGWHQDEAESALVKWAISRERTRILVPLCGKSLDLVWLASQGFEVIGVELSPIACEAFFSENKILCRRSHEGDFEVFSGAGIKLFNGDFFKLEANQLGEIGAVYDRAALIALPTEVRGQYTAHLKKLIFHSASPGFGFLQVYITRTPHDLTGPPFSVPFEEIENHYGERFKIECLSREAVTARAPEGSTTEESVLSLTIHEDVFNSAIRHQPD